MVTSLVAVLMEVSWSGRITGRRDAIYGRVLGQGAGQAVIKPVRISGQIIEGVGTEDTYKEHKQAAERPELQVLQEQARLRRHIQIVALPGNQPVSSHDFADLAGGPPNPMQCHLPPFLPVHAQELRRTQ